jgi:hypothetical protein
MERKITEYLDKYGEITLEAWDDNRNIIDRVTTDWPEEAISFSRNYDIVTIGETVEILPGIFNI